MPYLQNAYVKYSNLYRKLKKIHLKLNLGQNISTKFSSLKSTLTNSTHIS